MENVRKTDADIRRQKAEELLKKQGGNSGSQRSEIEMQKLIHELQVHQIEIELMNEEFKKAKDNAKVIAEKYIKLYDFAPTGYFTLSMTGEILEVNHAGAKLLGKDSKSLKTSQFGFYVSDDKRPIFNSFLDNLFAGKARETCEVTLFINNKTLVYVNLTGIITENGEHCLVHVENITERKLAEKKELLNAQEKYQVLAENISDVIYELNIDNYMFSYVSPSVFELTGYTPEERMETGFGVIVAPEFREKVNQEIQSAYKEFKQNHDSSYKYRAESQLIHKNGNRFWAETIISFHVGKNGENLSVGVTRNIDQRKRIEELLMENNSKLEQAMQMANMAWWAMDIPTGNVTFDKRKTEMIGYSAENFKHYKDFTDLLHPDDYDQAINAMRGHFAGLLNKFEVEYRIKTKSGEYKWFYDYGAIVAQDAKGKPLFIRGYVIDITERKQAEEKLKKKVEELEHFNSMAVNREIKMIELKQTINELSLQQGLAAPYKLDFLTDDYRQCQINAE